MLFTLFSMPLRVLSWALTLQIASRSTRPRATAFLTYAQQLVAAVRYVDSLVDPSGTAPFNNTEVAADFLAKLGSEPTMDNVLRIIYLRQAVCRFGRESRI